MTIKNNLSDSNQKEEKVMKSLSESSSQKEEKETTTESESSQNSSQNSFQSSQSFSQISPVPSLENSLSPRGLHPSTPNATQNNSQSSQISQSTQNLKNSQTTESLQNFQSTQSTQNPQISVSQNPTELNTTPKGTSTNFPIPQTKPRAAFPLPQQKANIDPCSPRSSQTPPLQGLQNSVSPRTLHPPSPKATTQNNSQKSISFICLVEHEGRNHKIEIKEITLLSELFLT